MIDNVIRHVLANDEEYQLFGNSLHPETGMADYRFATESDPHDSETVFWQTRWGGNFVFVSKSKNEVKD